MNMGSRTYDMSKRSKAAEETEHRIIAAAVALWKKLPIPAITLEKVSEKSGVTVRTILRKFGSREGLLEACLHHRAGELEVGRAVPAGSDMAGIVEVLVDNYEEMGEGALATIYLEPELSLAGKINEKGREFHRRWCEEVFADYLPDKPSAAYHERLHAFIAATEVYLWKLLRKDLGLSVEQTRQTFLHLLEGLARKFEKQDQ